MAVKMQKLVSREGVLYELVQTDGFRRCFRYRQVESTPEAELDALAKYLTETLDTENRP